MEYESEWEFKDMVTVEDWKGALETIYNAYLADDDSAASDTWVTAVVPIVDQRIANLLPPYPRFPGGKGAVSSVYRILISRIILGEQLDVHRIDTWRGLPLAAVKTLREFFAAVSDPLLLRLMAAVKEETEIPEKYENNWLRYLAAEEQQEALAA
jgi:hypothetical protein